MEIAGYRRPPPGTQPEYLYPPYSATLKRAPAHPLVLLPHSLSEVTGPAFGPGDIGPNDSDLTAQHAGEPLGERILVTGRVVDENGRAVPHTLIEIWQANAAGRYRHQGDRNDAPLDPNFTGYGRAVTDADGWYRFVTVKPGPYPWGDGGKHWRPAHVHFSLLGPSFARRLVTEMYFPGDPLLPFDPIFNSIPDEKARSRLVCAFDWEHTIPGRALGFRFDLVLRGRAATPWSDDVQLIPTPNQTVGPYFHLGLAGLFQSEIAPPGVAGERLIVMGRVIDGDNRPVPDAMIEVWQADASGRYAHPEDRRGRPVDARFRGFGRVPADPDGVFRFSTVKPGAVPGSEDQLQAPHLLVSVFVRGLLKHLVTRMYLPDEGGNAQDPILALVQPARRATLVATSTRDVGVLEWNIVLQGEGETVFFDC